MPRRGVTTPTSPASTSPPPLRENDDLPSEASLRALEQRKKDGKFAPGHQRTRIDGINWVGDYDWTTEFPRGIYLDEDIPEMLAKLSPRQRTYVAARIRGESHQRASDRVHVTESSARSWERSPWWESACDIAREKYFGNVNAQILPLIPAAVERIKTELTGDNEDLAHASAIWVLEKIGGKPTQTQVTKGDTQASPAQEVVAILRALSDVTNPPQPALEQGEVLSAEVHELTLAPESHQ